MLESRKSELRVCRREDRAPAVRPSASLLPSGEGARSSLLHGPHRIQSTRPSTLLTRVDHSRHCHIGPPASNCTGSPRRGRGRHIATALRVPKLSRVPA